MSVWAFLLRLDDHMRVKTPVVGLIGTTSGKITGPSAMTSRWTHLLSELQASSPMVFIVARWDHSAVEGRDQPSKDTSSSQEQSSHPSFPEPVFKSDLSRGESVGAVRAPGKKLIAAGGLALLTAIAIVVWIAVDDNSSSDPAAAARDEPAEQLPQATSAPLTSSATVPQATVPSVSALQTTVPSALSPRPTVAIPPRGDLQLQIPMSVPKCDGTGIVVLYSATNPATYVQEIASQLASNAGSQYLRTDNSCASLRQQTSDGNAIYAVYRLAGPTEQGVCSAVDAAGGEAYGKWLDSTTDPSYILPC